jgi:hypothetical protein
MRICHTEKATMKHHKGRHHHHHKTMPKQLTDIVTEAQALATVSEDQFEAALATVVADLQAVIAGTTAADPVVKVTTTTQSGVTAEFVQAPNQA